MNDFRKWFALLMASILTLSFAACGGAASSTSSAATAPSAGAASTASPAGGGEKLQVALLLPGSLNDGGWNANAYAGLKKLEDKGYTVAFTESIPISGMEEAFNNYASNGFNLVIGHGFQFGEPALRVAPNYPDVNFFVSGKMPDGVTEDDLPSNTGFMDMREYEAAYLAGIVAGGMTKSNIIGVVAGAEIPSQVSNMAAFVKGVESYNKDAKVYGLITGTFEDPTKGQEAALAQIDNGADVICQTADSTGVGAMEAAASKGVFIVGYGADQNASYPDLVLTCIVTDNTAVIEAQAQRIEDGTFGKLWTPGVADGIVYITPYHSLESQIPDEVKAAVDKAIAGLNDGSLVVPEIQERIDQKM